MTGRRLLAALLARLFPGRGRHHRTPGADDTVILPRLPGVDLADEQTRFDLSRARPYVRPADDDDGTSEFRGFLS